MEWKIKASLIIIMFQKCETFFVISFVRVQDHTIKISNEDEIKYLGQINDLIDFWGKHLVMGSTMSLDDPNLIKGSSSKFTF